MPSTSDGSRPLDGRPTDGSLADGAKAAEPANYEELRTILVDELIAAEAAIDNRLKEVETSHKLARMRLAAHIQILQDSIAKREAMFSAQLQRIETMSVEQLNQQRYQLQKIRRVITKENIDVERVERCLLTLEIPKNATLNPRAEEAVKMLGSWAIDPMDNSTNSISAESILPENFQNTQKALWLREIPDGNQAENQHRRESSKGSISDRNETTIPLAKLESPAEKWNFLSMLRERLLFRPCVPAEIELDFRESYLVGNMEIGNIITMDLDGFRHPFVNESAALGGELLGLRQEAHVLPKDVKKFITLIGGCVAGMTSASLTHFLDVQKVLRQLGKKSPSTFRGYVIGLPMGAMAQGQRFGVTLLFDETLQPHLKKLGSSAVISFAGSMLASGTGELLANPPVVVKNYQIARSNPHIFGAIRSLYAQSGVYAFSKGVVAGVIRKSLANAIVLQTVGPCKEFLTPYLVPHKSSDLEKKQDQQPSLLQRMGVGFFAGGITGSFAEVATNYPDRIKTLMQTKSVSFHDAALEAARDPFRGAMWAGIRKGIIRGINWGSVGVYTALFENIYWRYRKVSL